MHKRPRMKTLLRTQRTACAAPRPIRLGHMTNSLFTLQSTPRAAALTRERLSLVLLRTRRAIGGAPVVEVNGIRTDDLLLAKQALSQLSYTPVQRSEDQGSGDQKF